jgi:hypothetical protein
MPNTPLPSIVCVLHAQKKKTIILPSEAMAKLKQGGQYKFHNLFLGSPQIYFFPFKI